MEGWKILVGEKRANGAREFHRTSTNQPCEPQISQEIYNTSACINITGKREKEREPIIGERQE